MVGHDWHYVSCVGCGVSTPGRVERQQAIDKWNSRPSPWRESAKDPPPKDRTWIFGRWSHDNIQAIHIARWTTDEVEEGWRKLDGTLLGQPKWWMPIPPLEGR